MVGVKLGTSPVKLIAARCASYQGSRGWLVGGQNWGWLGKIQELQNDSSVYIYILF